MAGQRLRPAKLSGQAVSESSTAHSPIKRAVRKEVALLVGLLFFGIVLMPIAIFVTGQAVFGDYGGHGYGDFFGTLSAKLRAGDLVAWFLVTSPYLAWQCLRLMAFGWRATRKV